MLALREQIAAVAPLRSTVLLCGETGTGKGLAARRIHEASGRAGAFVQVDCASLPTHLAESELFGHERGSFTGAVARRTGRFERAADGTLFLDEIGELSERQQGKLLRVLQDREFERVGGSRSLRLSARVVAATSRDLPRAVADGCFRADLYFRLNVIRIAVPPLRQRVDDIPALVSDALKRLAGELALAPPQLSRDALDRLCVDAWPGNVRELFNVLERTVVRHPGGFVDRERIDRLLDEGRIPSATATGGDAPRDFEPDRIRAALRECGGNVTRAARRLGVPRSTLRHRIRRLALRPDRPATSVAEQHEAFADHQPRGDEGERRLEEADEPDFAHPLE
jgi:transcriptional regulator with GAF, ATPase, and Fis domain